MNNNIKCNISHVGADPEAGREWEGVGEGGVEVRNEVQSNPSLTKISFSL